MPLLLGLFLVALFIWFAENIGTLHPTWLYPHQMSRWSMVSLGKLSSWFLLLIISYVHGGGGQRPSRSDRHRAMTAELSVPANRNMRSISIAHVLVANRRPLRRNMR